MNARYELIKARAEEALAQRAKTYDRAREAARERAEVAAASRLTPAEHWRQMEDSAARMVSQQYGVPIDDVTVNGRRYGDILRERARPAFPNANQ